jgi:hypothetical protein
MGARDLNWLAYKQWEASDAELRNVRDEYIQVGVYRPGTTIRPPRRVLDEQGFKRLQELERVLDDKWRAYRGSL